MPIFSKQNILRGAIIYSVGDSLAAIILHAFSWERLLGMVLIGATFYAFEIPNYFRWIDKKVSPYRGFKGTMYKTALAVLYFNPLWIARHLFFIHVFSGQLDSVGWDLFGVAGWSFLVNIPLSLLANYLIQNLVPLKWRFLASAIFSALMAVYYALSMVFFK